MSGGGREKVRGLLSARAGGTLWTEIEVNRKSKKQIYIPGSGHLSKTFFLVMGCTFMPTCYKHS